jgi:hypothetical protein
MTEQFCTTMTFIMCMATMFGEVIGKTQTKQQARFNLNKGSSNTSPQLAKRLY